jgi:hypothetical protein
MNFLFVLYFVGIILAVIQDVKRREVDDWLNLSLFLSGTAYLFIEFGLNDFSIVNYGFFVFCMALVSFLLYNGRFFAGGDAKLVFALTPFFYDVVFVSSITNFFSFFIFLVFAGALYGLGVIFYLSIKNLKKVKEDLKSHLKNNFLFRVSIFFVFALVLLGFLESIFFVFAISFFIMSVLFVITKSLETISFTMEKNYRDLQEGDWLVKDVSVRGKTIRATWDGLSKEDIDFLKKNKKSVIVREGIPYAPAFLVAFILYFFKGEFLRIFFGF